MTDAQLEFYTIILPFTTVPAILILLYFRFKVIPSWFSLFDKENNDND